MRRRTASELRATGWVALALGALSVGAPARAQENVAEVTLSGYASAPYADRSVRVGEEGVDIAFRAPVSGPLVAFHFLWRRAAAGCVLDLHEDAAGHLGEVVQRAMVADTAGWVQVPIDLAVVAGARYHARLACPANGNARLGYILDRDPVGTRAGAWDLIAGATIRPDASPLFAITYADGRSWGQPYRTLPRRGPIRLCGANEASQIITSATPLAVSTVQVPATGRSDDLEFSLATAEGTLLMSGPLVRGARRGRAVYEATGAATPVVLQPGVPYVLRLRAPTVTDLCVRQRPLTTGVFLGRPVHGIETTDLAVSADAGQTWQRDDASLLAVTLVGSVPVVCGDNRLQPSEPCDGAADDACPGLCTDACACAAPPTTTSSSTTSTTRSTTSTIRSTTSTSTATTSSTEPPTSTTSTTSSTVPTTTAPRTGPRRAIYASGYFGLYNANTITPWPQRLGVILGEANAQGPLVARAKEAAVAAGNPEARFAFYLSLTSIDSKCQCFDSAFYDSFVNSHPEWFLHDAGGSRLSTFVYEYGAQRQFAVDIGNPAFIDAWADWALAAMAKYGWDGVWVDNILRGNFYGWSGWPIDPRTNARYVTADYRRDTLAALKQLRRRLDARGKLLIGNHAAAWEADTFSDPVVQQQITTMHGVEIEDCVYNFDGNPHPESNWIAQVKYLDYANRNGVFTQCRGGNGTIGSSAKREYILASYLLTKEGVSNVAQLNNLTNWWPQLEANLGNPVERFSCLDPASGLAATASCPSTGKIYSRRWERGRVLVNPTAGTTVTVQLGETLVRDGTPVTAVTLGPRSGAVLVRP